MCDTNWCTFCDCAVSPFSVSGVQLLCCGLRKLTLMNFTEFNLLLQRLLQARRFVT